MIMILKAAALFLAILVVLPLTFFLLIGFFGNLFAVNFSQRALFEKPHNSWLQALRHKLHL